MDDQDPSRLFVGSGGLGPDDEGISFAAEAAAQAMSESDAVEQQVAAGGVVDEEDEDESMVRPRNEGVHVCRICGRGDEEGRPMLRFMPVAHDLLAAAAAPGVTTFTEDISLHIFCGKTASILPSINQPDLEILTKAGLKNKHGIGSEVNAALARTRCAILAQDGVKEKQFYLVSEFEAHLAGIRQTHITFAPESAVDYFSVSNDIADIDSQRHYVPDPTSSPDHLEPTTYKVAPHKAVAGQVHKVGRRQQEETVAYATEVSEDGKVRCGCGGTHLPTGTARGVQSWRSHVMTKRHQKWMEDNGMLGAV